MIYRARVAPEKVVMPNHLPGIIFRQVTEGRVMSMKQQSMLPINAFYLTWLRDKGKQNRPPAKRLNKRTGEVVSKTQMDATDFVIYVMLLTRADKKTLICYPSIETICMDSFISDRRTAWDHLQELEQMDFIQITKTRGKANQYFMSDFARWRENPHY